MAEKFTPIENDQFLRIAEAAPLIGYRPKGFRRLLAEGRIPFVRLNPRSIRVRKSALVAFMRQHEIPARQVNR